MGNASGLSQSQLEKLLQTSDLGSKIDVLERVQNLSVLKSPPTSTVQAKQQNLQLGREFEFGKVNSFQTGVNAPTRFDAEVGSCLVRGQVPLQIDGTFYRITCDPIYANRNGKDIWINGDGAIQAWRFSNGVVDFKQKYVRSPRFVYERAARQSLFGTYRNPFAGDERVFDDVQSPGNTHIHKWHGWLLACKEDSPPIAIDPDTLDTIGIYDFEGQINPAKTFTAHPKVDAVTGEAMGYSMEACGMGSNDLVYYRFDRHGKKVDECWVKTPDVTWTHDMVATEKLASPWVIFHMSNYQIDLNYMKNENGTHFRLNRFLPNRFGVLPRRNPKPEDVRWFDSMKNHTWGHFSNGFDGEDGCIYLDAYIANIDTLNVFPNMHPELDIGKPAEKLNGKLARFKIDPKAASNELELPIVLSEVAGEMARCDDRYIAKPYNNAYGTRHSPTGFDAIVHVDIAAGITNIWEAGEGVVVGEPCFVPKQADSPEGDGYLLVCTRDVAKHQAHLTLLDATNIIAGPVCIVELPFQLCEGVHGNWVETKDLPLRKPMVDYSGVTKAIQAKFGTGAPRPYDEFTGNPVTLTRAEAVPNPRLS
ncbi:Carotenoid 910(9 10)-cleavage dioxygenase [Fusarium acutatum]|uniref:Carotenoid 910(9 10)-cleavage dioxygenase n=1 Tax=Fusarium acutatum TaxID=78861 RepID=A0A8H4NLF8_9HYPO|nr:Carotenoid 910(9 10)-cleavage dioxygenase [Fusarium acutatum]